MARALTILARMNEPLSEETRAYLIEHVDDELSTLTRLTVPSLVRGLKFECERARARLANVERLAREIGYDLDREWNEGTEDAFTWREEIARLRAKLDDADARVRRLEEKAKRAAVRGSRA